MKSIRYLNFLLTILAAGVFGFCMVVFVLPMFVFMLVSPDNLDRFDPILWLMGVSFITTAVGRCIEFLWSTITNTESLFK